MINPWMSSQQIVRHVSINELTHYLRPQVSDLTFDLDLIHRVRTIGVEAINSSLGGTQPIGENPECFMTLQGIMLNMDFGLT